jgi:hypothetical protein
MRFVKKVSTTNNIIIKPYTYNMTVMFYGTDFLKSNKTQPMKKTQLLTIFALLVTLSSCELIGDIFEAGVWVGVIMVVGVVGLVFWLISRLFGRK